MAVVVAFKKAVFSFDRLSKSSQNASLLHGHVSSLTSESVECASLSFEGINDIHGGDSLSLGVLCVGNCITDDILEEDLEYTSGLFVDQTRDSLHSTTTRQSANSWLRDTLDVVPQNLTVTLCSSFAKSLSTFSTSRHLE